MGSGQWAEAFHLTFSAIKLKLQPTASSLALLHSQLGKGTLAMKVRFCQKELVLTNRSHQDNIPIRR